MSIGNNTLLKTIDMRNCTAFGTGDQKTLDLSLCTNIEEVYLDGTALQGVSLPNGGVLKKIHYPSTITNFTLLNQNSLNEFVMPSYSNITTLRLENVSNLINSKSIIQAIGANSRVRLIGINWTMTDSTETDAILDILDTMRGLDETGGNVATAQVSGTIHTPSITATELAAFEARYPYITFTYDHISANLNYYTWDGSTLLETEVIVDGANTASYSGQPTRSDDYNYSYEFAGWNTTQDAHVAEAAALTGVIRNRNVYAAYSVTPIYHLKYYTYDGGELLYDEAFVGGNDTGTYSGTPARAQTVHEAYTFVGWSTSQNATAAESGALTIGTANKNVYAAYSVTQLVVISYYNYDGTELLHEEGVLSGGNGTWNGSPTRTATERILYNFAGWSSTTNATANESGVRSNITQDTTVYAAYSETTITYLKYYNYDGSELLHIDTIYNGGSGSWDGSPARTATAQYSYSFVGWSTSMNSTTATSGATTSVSSDRNVYAAYSQTVRSYTVYFYNGSTLLQSKTANYGASATYTGSTPVYNGSDPGEWTFTGWSPSPSNITGNTSCYAQYADTSSLTGKYLSGSMTSYNSSTNTTIGAYSLRNRTSMTTVSAPATTVWTYAFQGDTALTTATFSGDDCSIGEYAFSGCTALTTVNLTGFGTPVISANAFNGCSNMNALVISAGNMATLSNVNAFTGTKIAKGAGAIYVQSSLVAVYKANANWSQFFIASLEDYPLTDFSSITDSWSEIFAAEDNGTYSSRYVVGDTKKLNVNGNDVYMQIVAMDTDELASGSGNAKITWISKELITTHRMNATSTMTGGWEVTEMRTWLRDTILPTIDSTVRSEIKEVTKTYYDYGTTSTKSCADTVWIPSGREVFGGSSYEGSGCVYSGIFNSNSARIKKNLSGSAYSWWLRSARSGNGFWCVSGSGSAGNGNASGTFGVALGFCT